MTAAVAESPVDALLSTAAIRERCRNIATAVSAGRSRFFRVDRARLGSLIAAMVASEPWREALQRYRWLDRYLEGDAFSRFAA